jgi:hypothetical protein
MEIILEMTREQRQAQFFLSRLAAVTTRADIKELAQIVIPDPSGEAAFWTRAARVLLEGIVMAAFSVPRSQLENGCPVTRVLQIRKILTLDKESYLAAMRDNGGEEAWFYVGQDQHLAANVMVVLRQHLAFMEELGNFVEDCEDPGGWGVPVQV